MIALEVSMEQVPWYVSLIVSWLPLLVTIGSLVWLGRRITKELRTPDGRSIASVVDNYGRELKRSNDMLEQALADAHMRLEALEQRN
jgi:hypothetical protein